MKSIFAISMFCVLFSLALSFYASTGYFSANFNPIVSQSEWEQMASEIKPPAQDSGSWFGGNWVSTFYYYGKIMYYAVNIYDLLVTIGVPANIAFLISAPVYAIYIISAVEFFSGRELTVKEA
jgi:hypothetical protein